jgi:hypothetical protein
MDQPTFQRRIDSGSVRYILELKNICGEEWIGSLDK